MLTIANVSKRFGTHQANADVSFTANAGRIVGLLGPNGAGKTTLIRMITNIIIPDSGSISLDGTPVDALRQNDIGYLPEERGLYKKLTVLRQIVYFGRLKGLSEREATIRAMTWLQRMDAGDWANRKVQELSKGMQQKVQFIATVLHTPKLLILDEPFSGLDPVNAELLISVVRSLRSEGTTILLSTHQMDQVEKLCDDIVLINRGTVVLQGAVREVRSRFRQDRIHVTFDGDAGALATIEGTSVGDAGPGQAELKLDGSRSSHDVMQTILDRVAVTSMRLAEPSLNDIFIASVKANSGQA